MKTKFTFIFAIAMLVAVGLNAQTVLLTEGFNGTTIPDGWTQIDADGDGFMWEIKGAPGVTGNGGEGNAVTSASWQDGQVLTPDNYLITPAVAGAETVKYFASGQDAAYPAEHYAVMASSTGTAAADFTVVFEETMTAKPQGTWYERNIELPAGTVYVAFRHYNVSDQFWLNIDDVEISGTPTSITNLQQQGIRVIGGKGMLTISANDAAAAQIFNVTGQLVNTVSLSKTETTIQLSAGVYLVRVGKNVAKVLVK